MEGGVEGWKEGVAEFDCITNDGNVRFARKVWFSAFGVDMGVGAEEGIEGTSLVPSSEKLFRWVTKESTNIG